MSYIVIEIYSFACDFPGCSRQDECAPAAWAAPRLLDAAHGYLRGEGWTIVGAGTDRKHFCPNHKPEKD